MLSSAVGSLSRLLIAYMSAACVLILAAFHIIREIVWLFLNVKAYFSSLQNYIEWLLYCTATVFVIFVYINYCGCPSSWQWQIGIFCVFLAWLNLIFFASNIPGISLYVIMFKEIFLTFFKLILFALLLITAFSLILFMMFHNPTPTAKVYLYMGLVCINCIMYFITNLVTIIDIFVFQYLNFVSVNPEHDSWRCWF